jgi:hemoglobin
MIMHLTKSKSEWSTCRASGPWFAQTVSVTAFLTLSLGVLLSSGCRSGTSQTQQQDYFTSGSREADQRASQRMAKAEQLAGSGEGAGEKEKVTKSTGSGSGGGTNAAVKSTEKTSLYERLGAQAGISNIVSDAMARLLQDPRVNWDRKEVKRGGLFHHNQNVTWSATPQNVGTMNLHMVQFLTLATGGPAQYQGKEMRPVHSGLHISNAEFDAAVGDFKATLDKLKVPNREQKELLAIIESTRPEIVEER